MPDLGKRMHHLSVVLRFSKNDPVYKLVADVQRSARERQISVLLTPDPHTTILNQVFRLEEIAVESTEKELAQFNAFQMGIKLVIPLPQIELLIKGWRFSLYSLQLALNYGQVLTDFQTNMADALRQESNDFDFYSFQRFPTLLVTVLRFKNTFDREDQESLINILRTLNMESQAVVLEGRQAVVAAMFQRLGLAWQKGVLVFVDPQVEIPGGELALI